MVQHAPKGQSTPQCCCTCEVLLKAACDACGACESLLRQHVMHLVQGLIDAHVHMLIGGSSLHQIDLRGIASKADFVAAIQDAAGGLNV